MTRLQILTPLRLPRGGFHGMGWGQETSPCSWPLEEGCLRARAASPPDLIAGDLLFPTSVCLRGLTGLWFPPSLLQIIRKVVRQIDSSSADDTQEHEEVIAEGPLEDPREMEADVDSFMRHAQVLQRLRPPEAPAALPAAHLCTQPLRARGRTTLPALQSPPCASMPSGRQPPHGPHRISCLSLVCLSV